MNFTFEAIKGAARRRRIHKTSTLTRKPADQRTAADWANLLRADAKRERRKAKRIQPAGTI